MADKSTAIGFDKISFDNLTGKELEEKLGAVFSTLGDVMAEKLIPGIAEFVRNGEGAFEALVRVSAQTAYMTDAFDVLGMTLQTWGSGVRGFKEEIDGVVRYIARPFQRELSEIETARVVQGLADLSGGFDALADNVSGFLDLVMPEAEKTERLGQRLAAAFAEVGQPMPSTTDALRDLVAGLDVTTDHGQRAFVTITELTPALASYYDTLRKGEEDRADFTRSLTERIEELTLSADALAETRLERTIAGWYEEAARLGADTSLVDQLAELERAALNTGSAAQSAARDFGSLINSLQSQIVSAQRGLQTYGLSGHQLTAANAGFAFADNMAAAAGSPEAQKLAQDLYNLNMQMAANQQATEAAAAAQQAAAERERAYAQAVQDRERAIAQAQQNLDQARRDVIDAYNREADALRKVIDAADAAAQRVADASRAVVDAYNREADTLQKIIDDADAAARALDSARQAVVAAYEREASALREVIAAHDAAAQRVAEAGQAVVQAYEREAAALQKIIDGADAAARALDGARQAVVAAYEREAAALQKIIDSADAAASAVDSARQEVERAIDAEISAMQALVSAADDAARRLADAQGALKQAYDAESAPLRQTIDRLGQLGQTLRDFSQSIGVAATSTAQVMQRFDTLAAKARAGDVSAMEQLPQAGQAALDAARGSMATRADFDRYTAQVQRQALEAAAAADAQVSDAQRQLDALTEQVTALGVLNDSVLSVKDAIANLLQAQDAKAIAAADAAKAQTQIDRLQATRDAVVGVDARTLTVDAAIRALSTAQQDQARAQAEAATAKAQLSKITDTVDQLGLLNTAQQTLKQAITALSTAQQDKAAADKAATDAKAQLDKITATVTALGVLNTAQQTLQSAIKALSTAAQDKAVAEKAAADAKKQLDEITATVDALGLLNTAQTTLKEAVTALSTAQQDKAAAEKVAADAKKQLDEITATVDALGLLNTAQTTLETALKALSTAQADDERARGAARAAAMQLTQLDATARATGALETAQLTLRDAVEALTSEREAKKWADDAAEIAKDQLRDITETANNIGLLGQAQQTLAEAIGALGSAQAAMAAAANRPVIVNVSVNAPAQQAAPQIDFAKLAELQKVGIAMAQMAAKHPRELGGHSAMGMEIGRVMRLAYEAQAESVRDQIRQMGAIPAFATGGAFTNGIVQRPTTFNMGLMGEAGSEGILPLANVGGKLGVHAIAANDGAMVDELKALRAEVAHLRREQAASQYAIAANTGRLDRRQDKWDRDGLPVEREAVA